MNAVVTVIRQPRRGPQQPAVFFDRDGVLNVDYGYVHDRGNFDWSPGAEAAIQACNRAGVLVFVVTNQSGIAHGYFTESAVQKLHSWMVGDLGRTGAWIDAISYCPHHPEAKLAAFRQSCRCRKPAPGMIEELASRWPVDRKRSVLIGDKDSDLEAAASAGIRGVRYVGGRLDDFARAVVPELRGD